MNTKNEGESSDENKGSTTMDDKKKSDTMKQTKSMYVMTVCV